jgi:hypothetical protein
MHPSDMNSIQSQLEQLHRGQHGMSQHMLNLSQDYQAVIGELMSFQRNMVAQDQLMQNLIQYLVNLEAGESHLPRDRRVYSILMLVRPQIKKQPPIQLKPPRPLSPPRKLKSSSPPTPKSPVPPMTR